MTTCPETLSPPPLGLTVSHLFYSIANTVIPVWGQVSPGRAYDLGLHTGGTGGTLQNQAATGGRELHLCLCP